MMGFIEHSKPKGVKISWRRKNRPFSNDVPLIAVGKIITNDKQLGRDYFITTPSSARGKACTKLQAITR